MKITRLQLLIALLGVIFLIFGVSTWMKQRSDEQAELALERAHALQAMNQRKIQKEPAEPPVNVPQEEADAAAHLRTNAKQTIAIVGEAYKPLLQRYGEINEIGNPLRAAKTYLEDDKLEQALDAAKEAWKAVKDFREHENPVSGVYTVRKGDTLWRVAVTQSPFHQGPGRVTIWKANKEEINDFDRVEVGTKLQIPIDPKAYILPYWRPRALQR